MNVLKRSASLVTAYLLAVSVFSASPISDIVRLTANAECQTIVNDTFWKDTNGNNIYSQGGGVFQFGDTYYWYGVHYIKDYGGAERQIALNNKIDSWQEVSLTDIQITNGKIQVGVYSDANAGNWGFFDDFSLVGNGNVQEPEPIHDGRFISSLNVNDSANRTKWSIQESLSSGDTVFGDRAFKFVDVLKDYGELNGYAPPVIPKNMQIMKLCSPQQWMRPYTSGWIPVSPIFPSGLQTGQRPI